MTAAVPDPRFRDQLAEAAIIAAGCVRDEGNGSPFCATHEEDGNPPWHRCRWVAVLDALKPTIAAEVEARVQAAANQRAAEIVTRVKAIPTYTLTNDDKPLGTVVLADDVLAALASPAPAPRAEEGQQ